MDWRTQIGRIRHASDSGGQGSSRLTRPLVPGIPSRVVDPSGVVKRQGSAARMKTERPQDGRGESTSGGALTIGRGVAFKGEVCACDCVVIEGEAEATVPARLFQVSETGRFIGTAEVEEAEVAGRFEGTLIVRRRLTVQETGRILGTIRYGELAIVAGGQISGDVQVGSADSSAPADSEAAAAQTPQRAASAPETEPTPHEDILETSRELTPAQTP